MVKVPFPPSTSVDEVTQIHLKNGINNVNRTMNAFMIYRKEFKYAHKNSNLSCKNMSKLASKSWKNEPEYVKDYYKQMSKKVKERFKETVPTLYFINKFGTSNQVGTNENHVSLETNPPMEQNSLGTISFTRQFLNIGQNSPDITYSNPPLMDQNSLGITFPDPLNIDKISPEITYYNYPFTKINQSLGTSHYNSPPSNSLNTRQQSVNMGQTPPDATYSNPHVDKNLLEITFPVPPNMSLGATCYNSPFININQNPQDVIDFNHFNPPPSNMCLCTTYPDYPLLNINHQNTKYSIPLISDNFKNDLTMDDEISSKNLQRN